MSWFKRILLGLIILAGLIGTLKDYKYFGLFGALGLFIIFLLSTIFLWQWASGRLPEITKLHAILILLASAIASIFVINMAIAGNLHVDLMEVMRVTITHNPLFLSDSLRGCMGKSGHLAMAVKRCTAGRESAGLNAGRYKKRRLNQDAFFITEQKS
ncbi:hypothetical protein [Citrobacter freundii]|uniref:Uncharacterized protein n=1 Tax=Citrobacter freundii TaxID=546 RepID=A0A7G2IHZ9_CITFR|nr:hypothetical protein [Citrobacter freundii]